MQGVRALFLGDGDHASTNVNLNLSVGAAAFRPDFLFVEYSAQRQKLFDVFRGGVPEPNFFMMEALATEVGAKVVAVDVPKIARPYTPAEFAERISNPTHERIAEKIADRVEGFLRHRGRMPVFAVIFGKDHFATGHDLDEIVQMKLKRRGLPTLKEMTIEIDNERPVDDSVRLRRHWFGPFDYSVDVSKKVPAGIPDYTEFPSEGKASALSKAFPRLSR